MKENLNFQDGYEISNKFHIHIKLLQIVYIIGKTQYIKNLKSELNSKKQLTQIYFVIYGLLVAQLLGAVEKTGNNIVKTSAILYILIFLITMLSYYEEVTKTVNLTNLNISNINYQGILAGGAFSFSVFYT